MEAVSHRDRALEVARQCGIARGRDFDAAGVTRATVKRLCDPGVLQQIGRGLYKLADAPIEDRKSVVAGKRVSVRVDLGGRRIIKKTTQHKRYVTIINNKTLRHYT